MTHVTPVEALPRAARTQLAHAAVQTIADAHGIDLLHIKGAAVDPSLLAAATVTDPATGETTTVPRRRASVDADVLVRPSQVPRFIEALGRHGWRSLIRFEDGSAFEHASTWGHDFLAPLDIHRSFPGIRRDAEEAFDVLWADRQTKEIAGRPCPVPTVTAQRLVLLLHVARGLLSERGDLDRCWTAATTEQRQAVDALARTLNAEVALAAATGRLEENRDAPDYELWKVLTGRDHDLVALLAARVRAARTPWAKARVLVRSVVPNPHRMEHWLGRPPTTRELAEAYLERARLGVRVVADRLPTFRKPKTSKTRNTRKPTP